MGLVMKNRKPLNKYVDRYACGNKHTMFLESEVRELEAYTERLEKALKEIVLESSDLGVYAIALKALEGEEWKQYTKFTY